MCVFGVEDPLLERLTSVPLTRSPTPADRRDLLAEAWSCFAYPSTPSLSSFGLSELEDECVEANCASNR